MRKRPRVPGEEGGWRTQECGKYGLAHLFTRRRLRVVHPSAQAVSCNNLQTRAKVGFRVKTSEAREVSTGQPTFAPVPMSLSFDLSPKVEGETALSAASLLQGGFFVQF